jgi:hypothetical protein
MHGGTEYYDKGLRIRLIFEGGRDVVAFPEKKTELGNLFITCRADLKDYLNIYRGDVNRINFAHVFMIQNLPPDEAVVEVVRVMFAARDRSVQ